MNEHPAMIDLMQLALDGGLDAAAQGRLDAHVTTCAECARQWAGLQAVHGQLLAAPPLAAAGGFTARVLARIAMEQEQSAAIAAAPVAPAPALVQRPSAEEAQLSAHGVPAWPFVLGAGLLAVVSLALLLAPLAGLANLDALEGILSDTLGLLAVGIAWLSLLLAFAMVVVQAAGDVLLLAALVLGLCLTLLWIRLVGGADFSRRQTYMNGGM